LVVIYCDTDKKSNQIFGDEQVFLVLYMCMYILLFPLSDERKPHKPCRIAVMWPTLVSDVHFSTALPTFFPRVKIKIYPQLFLCSKLNYPSQNQDNIASLIFSINRQNSRKDITFYLHINNI